MSGAPGSARVAGRLGTPDAAGELALRLSAYHLFDLLLLRAARLSPLGLGSSLLAGGALYLLAFFPIFNLGCVCQCLTSFIAISSGFPSMEPT
jgi:hypothetical protein